MASCPQTYYLLVFEVFEVFGAFGGELREGAALPHAAGRVVLYVGWHGFHCAAVAAGRRRAEQATEAETETETRNETSSTSGCVTIWMFHLPKPLAFLCSLPDGPSCPLTLARPSRTALLLFWVCVRPVCVVCSADLRLPTMPHQSRRVTGFPMPPSGSYVHCN